MGNATIIFGDEVLMDLSNDTVTPENLLKGTTAHNANGDSIVGKMIQAVGTGDVIEETLNVNELATFWEKPTITVPGSGYKDMSVDITAHEGYEPVGVIGWHTAGQGYPYVSVYRCCLNDAKTKILLGLFGEAPSGTNYTMEILIRLLFKKVDTASVKSNEIMWGTWTTLGDLQVGQSLTATNSGMVRLYLNPSTTSGAHCTVTINGRSFALSCHTDEACTEWAPVSAGDIITATIISNASGNKVSVDLLPAVSSTEIISKNIKSLVFLEAHPVGSYYWTSVAGNPGDTYGGTWEQVKGRFMYACDDGVGPNVTGGSTSHTLTISEMPSHVHAQYVTANAGSGGSGYRQDYSGEGTGFSSYAQGINTGATGGGQPFAIMPPYLTAYCWKRTA